MADQFKDPFVGGSAGQAPARSGPVVVQPGSTLKRRGAEADVFSKETTAGRTAALTPGDIEKQQLEIDKLRREAKLGLTPGQQKVDERFAQDYADWVAGGEFQGVTQQLDQLDSALTALRSGKQLSGPVVGRLPLFVQQMLYGDDPKKIKDSVEKVVQASLRQILGAQFTEKEGANLMARTYDPTAGEEANIDRLLSTVRELRARAAAKQASTEYFGENGTLAGYKGPNFAAPGGWTEADTSRAEKQLFGEQPQETVWEKEAREAPRTRTEGGASETFVTAEAQRAAAAAEKAWREGATVEQMLQIDPTLDPELLKAAEVERAKGSKGRPVRFIPQQTGERPLSEQIIGAAAETPYVGPAMAAAVNAAPTAAMDEFAALMGGDADKTRFGLDYLRTKYPGASMTGDVLGNLAYTYGGASGLQRLGLSPLTATFAAETGLGAGRGGFGAKEDERLAGTLVGGGEGAIYGAIPGAVSRVANPRTPASVALMRREGVPMSVGQTLGLPRGEAAIGKVSPVGGDIALGAQRRGFEGFQQAYLNRAIEEGTAGLANPPTRASLQPLPEGLSPTERFGTAQRQFNEAYDTAKSNMTVRMDPDLRTEIFDFRNRLGTGVDFSEDTARRLNTLLDQQLVRRVGTRPSGQTYKDLDAFLGKRRAAFAKAGNAEMVEGVDEMLRMLRDNARRQSSPEAVAQMDAVDTGYSYLIRAEEAAAKQGSAPGEFTPQQLLGAVQKGDISARNRAFTRGEARGQEFAQAGVEALGKAPPEVSGLERGFGLAGGTTVGLPVNVAMGVANAPGVRQALNTAIAGTRPEWLQTAGRAVAEAPYNLAGPISSVPIFTDRGQNAETTEELLTNYGVRPEVPGSLMVGPALTELQKRYAEQQAAPVEPLQVGVSAPAAPAEVPQGESPMEINGRRVRYDAATDKFIDVETGEVLEGYARGGFVYALGA